MGFLSLKLYNFRNLENAAVSFHAPEVFLVGENGQGKTNCIEAIYLLCYGSSFRTGNFRDMISLTHETAAVTGSMTGQNNSMREVTVSLSRKDKKEIHTDGKRITDRKDMLYYMPCVVFAHDDLDFVTGSPGMKRHFFNQTLCMYDPQYLAVFRDFMKVLSTRNLLLRQQNRDLCGVYSGKLAEYGFYLQQKRTDMILVFNQIFSRYFQRVSKLPSCVRIVYKASWSSCTNVEECLAMLERQTERDFQNGSTFSGPHRDNFLFLYEDADFCSIASTGQLRLLSIMLRVAQAHFFMTYTHKKPLLLLDDVLLELDRGRRDLFLENLPEYEQAFFTFLPDEDYNVFRKQSTEILRVEKGKLEPWKRPEIF
ncbi:MAG: DNA replication/repair protein RecF [Spirochaetaceae bacterium]|nr:MAG: DNA replication/repair protein RecF [Spirochaetaceae bacterium]